MSDDARQVAFNPSAPPDERTDALGQLQKAHHPLASDLLPAEDLRPVIRYIEEQYTEAAYQRMLAKSARVIPFPGRERRKTGMQSVYLDSMQIFARGDYFERPSPIGFDALRLMVEQTPILNAVIMARIRQVLRFCAPQEDKGPGFTIRHLDKDHQLTAAEEKAQKEIMRFMNHCGMEPNPRERKKLKRDNFAQFASKLVRESLTYDSAPIETEMMLDKKKGIHGFYALDGSTIRLCTDEGFHGDGEIVAVQAIQGRVVTTYTWDDLIYEVRNPRADVRLAGYGLGEAELLVRTVTGFLNAMAYNAKMFDDNSIPKGILHLTGDYSQEDLAAFRRYWNSMVRGINNAWTLPVMVSRDAESKASFEPINAALDEMSFAKWMTFLVSIICAIYGMSPSEINFDSFTAGNTSALSGSDTAEKLAASKDSGLRPLMAYLESLFSDYLVQSNSAWQNFVFRWTGLDPEDEQQRHEMRKTVLTVNEIRAQEGYEAMEGPLGDAPVNPTLIGPWMQLTQAPEEAPEEEPGADEGGPPQKDASQGAQNGTQGDGEEDEGDDTGSGDSTLDEAHAALRALALRKADAPGESFGDVCPWVIEG